MVTHRNCARHAWLRGGFMRSWVHDVRWVLLGTLMLPACGGSSDGGELSGNGSGGDHSSGGSSASGGSSQGSGGSNASSGGSNSSGATTGTGNVTGGGDGGSSTGA